MKRKWTEEEVRQWYLAHPDATGFNTYSNPDDANLMVRKPRSQGWTLNFANPWSWVLQGGLIGIVLLIIFLL